MQLFRSAGGGEGGPFRLQKYFLISGFVVIATVTLVLAGFLYSGNINALLKNSENYARLLAENLNYNIFIGFYAPLKTRRVPMDLQKWDQFGALDALIKDFTYALKIRRIKIVDRQRKIIYSTDYDLIGRHEPPNRLIDDAFNGKDCTVILNEDTPDSRWFDSKLTVTYYPLREVTGNYWMLGSTYGILEISQDVTDQYMDMQRSVLVIILVAAGLMAFLFVTLTLIVRRGERILLDRAAGQKKLEEKLQQAEKLASIGQMVAVIAHEIRNPLGIIRSSSEMLLKKDNPEPARVKKLSGVIFEEAVRLSAILTDFLEFARPRDPSLRPVNIGELLRRVRNNLDQEIQTRRVTWMGPASQEPEPMAHADPDLLYQAFLNIAINAFEAMDEGGTFAVDVTPQNGRVRIDFADSGKGIEEDNLTRIFTPFFTTSEMGTGLGLSVVHNIITAHAGEIAVTSEQGKGSVFSILLPAYASVQ